MKNFIVCLASVALLLVSYTSQGDYREIFKCRDKDGAFSFSDSPCQTTSKADVQKYNEMKHRENIYKKKLNHILILFKSQKFIEARSYAEKNNLTDIYDHAVKIYNAEIAETEARARARARARIIQAEINAKESERRRKQINQQRRQLSQQRKLKLQPGKIESSGAINPQTGMFLPNVGGGVINPETGEYYPSIGDGFVNPITGEYYPSN